MEQFVEIIWHGRAGQGVVTASQSLARIMALEGKYVQALPQLDVQKRPPSVEAYNRFSSSPIKVHGCIRQADIVVIMDPALLKQPEIGSNAKEDAIFIINTAYEPEYLKEKLSIPMGQIYTLDAFAIAMDELGEAIPNIPLLAVIMKCLNWLPPDALKLHLQDFLSQQLKEEPELVDPNLATIDRALQEVKFLDLNEEFA